MEAYKGPYELTEDRIARVVTQDGPGNYLLGNEREDDDFHFTLYVGRSDTNLRARLEQHAREGEYAYFKFRYATSVKDAYEQECLAFHEHEYHINNTYHPDKPNGKDYPCPYSWCDKHQD